MDTTVSRLERGTPGVPQDPIVPILIITHVISKFGSEGQIPVVESMTMAGVLPCPRDLAEAFLTFISQSTTPYSQEELDAVTNVITEIHQRHYRESR